MENITPIRSMLVKFRNSLFWRPRARFSLSRSSDFVFGTDSKFSWSNGIPERSVKEFWFECTRSRNFWFRERERERERRAFLFQTIISGLSVLEVDLRYLNFNRVRRSLFCGFQEPVFLLCYLLYVNYC